MLTKAQVNNFEYDKEIDSLHIFGSEESEIEGSIVVGNLIFDVDTSGKVVGVEINNASKLLNAAPDFISTNINGAFLDVRKDNHILFLSFVIMLQKEKFNFSYMIARNKIALTC